MSICFKLGTDGWYSVTKGKIRLFCFCFCVRASFLLLNLTSLVGPMMLCVGQGYIGQARPQDVTPSFEFVLG